MPTLSALIASGSSVRFICQECRASGPVDLQALMALAGDLDLTDRHPPCRAPGCTYWVSFYAQQGMRNTPLRTHAGDMREMDRRTEWLRRVGPQRRGAQDRATPLIGRHRLHNG